LSTIRLPRNRRHPAGGYCDPVYLVDPVESFLGDHRETGRAEAEQFLQDEQDEPDGMEEQDFSHAGGLAERAPRPSAIKRFILDPFDAFFDVRMENSEGKRMSSSLQYTWN
jgi:hypothetical protein